MSQATLRSRLNTIIENVTNVGVVHDYERLTNDWSDFLDLFKTNIYGSDQIRGWMIAYRGFIDDRYKFGDDVLRTHVFNIFGMLGIEDENETEKTFSSLVESICDAIYGDATLAGLGLVVNGIQAETEPRVFVNITCHFAEITVTIQEEIAI